MSTPTAAARRQNLLDAIAAELTAWGCPDDYAMPRARHLLDVVAAHGWSLPAALLDEPPTRGPGSTDEGRAAARRMLEQIRAGCRCGPLHVGEPPDQHLTTCRYRQQQEGVTRGTAPAQEPPAGAGGLPIPPPGGPDAHRAAEGVEL